ncbi:MAG: VCBS repeat-containing protein [Planctomycetaceae bacterium]
MRFAIAALLLTSLFSTSAFAEFPNFKAETIDPAVAEKACYAVALADVDNDGKEDIVAVNESQVLWYRNPDWKKHVILDSQTELDNVCIAPCDIDGDGLIDFALGAGWTKIGTIQWITRDKDPAAKWHVHAIGQEIWTHRMRWADVLGTGKPQLVVSPLNAIDKPGVSLLAFEIPANPKADRWQSTAIDDSLNRLHNHWHIDFNGDGTASTLTASQEGLNLIRRNADGTFRRQLVGSGMPAEKPADQGAGEVKVGHLKGGRHFMATIEPMHGTSVAIYFAPPKLPDGELAERLVIEDTLKQGHAVWTADIDGDGDDEVVIGHREAGTGEVKGPGVYIFDPQDEGKRWEKHIVDDGGVAVEDLICTDLNGDGRIDIVAGGRATKNLKIYWNEE